VLADVIPEQGVSGWVKSFLSLSTAALDCGSPKIAALAERTAASLGAAGANADVSELISEAVVEMQGVLASQTAPSGATSLSQDAELIGDFVVECKEHLESIESQLLGLEQNAAADDAIHTLFRSFHTIKGLAGFLEFPLIQEVAHEVETVLDRCRQGELRMTESSVDIVLEARDYIAGWLSLLEKGPVPPGVKTPARPDALLARVLLVANGESAAPASERPQPAELSTEAERPKSARSAARVVKVDTAKLDYLVDMVGEMVIAQSLIRHDAEMAALKNEVVTRNLAQLARITDEVQRTAMAMRMVPVGPLFQKMARLVRDLSRRMNKPIAFESEGEGVELDRNIVEELADPLMHMVRNAVDHGLETAEQRTAAGKPVPGRVTVRASHRSGHIVIEVADDGRGIPRQRVLAKARQQGLLATGATPSDSETLNLIFHPGFSTADKVSDVSGRGVGMDVVRKQIQKLRGQVEISSVEGAGTTFSLRLPLTLAIIDGLVIATGGDRYIIPLASVREMLRPTAGMVSRIENRVEVVVIRNCVLPVVRLYERFGTTPHTSDPSEGVLVVAEADGTPFCLMVDELIGKQEVVIKSLGSVFDGIAGIAGGAILGDGHVGLILDLNGIFSGGADV
jgi:two-component system chemotaxis sensor kinase CheA